MPRVSTLVTMDRATNGGGARRDGKIRTPARPIRRRIVGLGGDGTMAWAELSDVRCYYELVGEGEPVLLIPGLGTTCRLWDPVAPELATSFSLILADNRNVGRSAGRRRPRSLSDLAADLVE